MWVNCFEDEGQFRSNLNLSEEGEEDDYDQVGVDVDDDDETGEEDEKVNVIKELLMLHEWNQ